MLINKTLNDPTQKELLKHLAITERLLSKCISKLSGKDLEATIVANTDLGIAHNVQRMLGGFYTGATYSWEGCTVPFVPVDTTVNVCGTALLKIDDDISIEEFICMANKAMSNTEKYTWNYTNGNHFISLVYSKGEYGLKPGKYLLLHASANEYKKDLYPSSTVWYKSNVKVAYDHESKRFIRFISGNPAVKFYKTAEMLQKFNEKRNLDFAELMLGNKIEEEILSIQHYGMPNEYSVCIGTHYECKTYTLLTAPGRAVYLVKPLKDGFMGTPHGFGLGLKNPKIIYHSDGKHITIGDKTFLGDGSESINIGADALVRCSNSGDDLDAYVSKILEVCPGSIVGKLHQLASISKDGINIW